MSTPAVVLACLLAAGLTACRGDVPTTSAVVPGGNPQQGRALIRQYGCGACHTIPGIGSAVGKVGPPLTDWAGRRYIAGALLNEPTNLARWIVSPQSIEPGTAMPTLGLTFAEATDVAAYLYAVGSGEAMGPPYLLPRSWLHALMPGGE